MTAGMPRRVGGVVNLPEAKPSTNGVCHVNIEWIVVQRPPVIAISNKPPRDATYRYYWQWNPRPGRRSDLFFSETFPTGQTSTPDRPQGLEGPVEPARAAGQASSSTMVGAATQDYLEGAILSRPRSDAAIFTVFRRIPSSRTGRRRPTTACASRRRYVDTPHLMNDE
jgi:hypothetical protein